jgi:hypothetical protein
MDRLSTYVNDQTVDRYLHTQVHQMVQTVAANASVLRMDAARLARLEALKNRFHADFDAVLTAKARYAAAITTKDASKQAILDEVRALAKEFRANLAVPDALLEELQMAPHRPPRSRRAPTPPTNLQAALSGLGNVRLTWDRNGNRPNTMFLLERRDDPESDWTLVTATTRTRHSLTVEPGRYVAFRIRAQRGKSTSHPTLPAVLYDSQIPPQSRAA